MRAGIENRQRRPLPGVQPANVGTLYAIPVNAVLKCIRPRRYPTRAHRPNDVLHKPGNPHDSRYAGLVELSLQGVSRAVCLVGQGAGIICMPQRIRAFSQEGEQPAGLIEGNLFHRALRVP